MEDVGIFYGHLVHFAVFCYILWTFGIVRGNLVNLFPFWYFVPRKIWQPCVRPRLLCKDDLEKKLALMLLFFALRAIANTIVLIGSNLCLG
jgi:hypothetical protein